MKPYYERDGVTIYHGDCREVLPTIDPATVDAVITDPPYEITATGGGIGAKRQYLADIAGFTDCGFDPQMLAAFKNWIVFGTLRQVPQLISAAGDRRWMLLTWNKPNPTPLCNRNYLPDTEYAIHAWSGNALFGECSDKSRFFIHPCEQGKSHPNQKPVPLMEKCVTNATDEGGLVLDPFGGSCTTAVAAYNLWRRAIVCEVEERWCEFGANRIDRVISQGRLFKPEPVVESQRSMFADADP